MNIISILIHLYYFYFKLFERDEYVFKSSLHSLMHFSFLFHVHTMFYHVHKIYLDVLVLFSIEPLLIKDENQL